MTTTCPEPGLLRAWLDRPENPTDEPRDEGHVAACASCQSRLGELARDAEHAAHALVAQAGPAPSVAETELALAHVRARLIEDETPALAATARAGSEATNGGGLGSGLERAGTWTPAPTSHPGVGAGVQQPIPPSPNPNLPPSRSPLRAGKRGRGSEALLPVASMWRRWRLALGGVAAALALTFVLATPEGQAVAAGFLAQFRSQRLAIVTINPDQARQTGLFRFEQLGTIKNNQSARPAEVASVQEAASRAGFPILQPDPATLPPGTSRTPKVSFSPGSETRLTFDKNKARAYFDSINRKDLSLPDKLHGSTLVVALPPVVMLEYTASDNKPAVMIGEAREVQVGVEGNASLEEVRNFLLGLPNVPPDVARQLRSIQDWTSTLPIPVPVDKLTWQETSIAGAQAYILNDNSGLGSGVIWQRDGRILGVAGPMKATELRRIAESLR